MQNKRRYIVFGVIISIVLCLTLLLVQCQREAATDIPNRLLEVDEGAVQWEGDKNQLSDQTPGTIAIPGFDELSFVADQKQQYVNFYNPEVNDCLFLMTLYVNGEPYWQSGYVEPGKGYYTLELSATIPVGGYEGELRIQCFKRSGTELNSARVTFDLHVLEDYT